MHDPKFHEEVLITLSCNIVALLAKRNMTVVNLVNASGVGHDTLKCLTNQTLILTIPTLQTLHKIASALDVPFWVLFTDDQRVLDKLP
jgi:DNA-binding Xre family transcriptional regulator